MEEITTQEEFQSWLELTSKDWAQVLSARLSLRVLPILFPIIRNRIHHPDNVSEIMLSIFRTTFIALTNCKYAQPKLEEEHIITAMQAAMEAATNLNKTFGSSGDNRISSAAATAVNAVVGTTRKVANSEQATVTAASNAIIATGAPDEIWKSINNDITYLRECTVEPTSSAQLLAEQNLWLSDKGENYVPEDTFRAITDLESQLFGAHDNWRVWIRWFWSVLQGGNYWELSDGDAEHLAVRIASQDDKFWRQGADVVNAEIEDWLENLKRDQTEQRRAIKQGISGLRQAITDTKPAHGGMGHNEPPEGLELSIEQTNRVEQVLDVIDAEMDKAEPSISALTHSANVLKTTLLWAAKKAELGVDAFVVQLAKAGAIAIVGMQLPIEWQKVYLSIGSVVEKILQWLSVGAPLI